MHFATPPASLSQAQWDDPLCCTPPGQAPPWWETPHETHFAVSDVYFAELAILSRICANGDAIFAIASSDQIFDCQFDGDQVERLARELLGS